MRATQEERNHHAANHAEKQCETAQDHRHRRSGRSGRHRARAVVLAFNGVKVSFLNYFAPVASTFAPYLAYIWQIQETDRRHIAYMWQVIPEKPQLEGAKLPPNWLVSKTNCHI